MRLFNFYDVHNDSTAHSVDDKSLIFEAARKCYDDELTRKNNVEHKATIYVGTISVVVSIVVRFLIGYIEKNNSAGCDFFIFILLSFVTLIFLISIFFALKALKKGNYSLIGIEDVLAIGKKDIFVEEMLSEIKKAINTNYRIINQKVDDLNIANKCMTFAIILLIVCVVAILCRLICGTFSNINISISILESINNDYLMIALGTLLLISIILNIYLLLNKKMNLNDQNDR